MTQPYFTLVQKSKSTKLASHSATFSYIALASTVVLLYTALQSCALLQGGGNSPSSAVDNGGCYRYNQQVRLVAY